MTSTLAALAACFVSGGAYAQTVAPAGPGNAQGPAPLTYFGSTGSHVQQIYSSDFFSGTSTINGISFRTYPGAAPSFFAGNTVNVSNITITAGTTAASGNDSSGLPSATFANNLMGGSVVYSGALTLTTAADGTTNPFDYTINFTNPFTYDSSMGSLILDFLIPTGATVSGNGFGFLTFDTANTLDDGAFSVVNIFDGSSATGTLSTAAAITQFNLAQAAPVPEPATWAMMLLGFGAAGTALRRGRKTKQQALLLA
jgi:hypothetical protein